MKVTSKGASETRVRIERLRLKVPAGDEHSARALARAVASGLASRAEDLAGLSGAGAVRLRVKSPASASRASLADSIAEGIAGARSGGRGRR